MTNNRLLIISNRLPFQFALKKGVLSTIPSSGGLVSSLKSYVEKIHASTDSGPASTLWIGAADVAEHTFRQHFNNGYCTHEAYTLHPVFVPAPVYDKHYNGFCNDTIWPLFHYFPSYVKFREDYYQANKTTNQLFAEKVAAVYQPGDLIWVHDYHLMLLPAMLRQLLPDATIGFFLHIPFPSFELFRMLASQWRKEILNGLLGADLIGFHTNDYAQYFLNSVRQLFGYDHSNRMIMTPERSILTDVFPVSIDFARFNQAINDSKTREALNTIRKNLEGIRMVVSVDRLDYTKALVNRLESVELFFEKCPEFVGKVSYVMLVVPSRDIITKYRENKKEIEETVSRINGKFGSIGYTPVIYQYRSVDFSDLAGLYMAADVALITPVRDGMNLVAKEFVASRSDKRGVLILSETAGAAAELGEALLVNPTDRHEIADALREALTMPEQEQEARHEGMQKRLGHYHVVKWAEDFISTLQHTKIYQERFNVKEMTRQAEEEILQKYANAEKKLLLFDYDGTLTPYARLPRYAVPGSELLHLLRHLGQQPGNTVVLVSGRPAATLDEWFGHLPVHLVAEHGAFIKIRNQFWIQTVQGNTEWKEAVLPVMDRFTERCAGTFVEQKELSVSWHYRNANNDLGFMRSRELMNILNEMSAQQDFQVIEGNKVVEARARGVNKGTAVNHWLSNMAYPFVLAIGDDRTDEDMFKAIPPEGFSIRVGLVSSAARYNFRSHKNVLALLEKLKELSGPELEKEKKDVVLPGNND